MNKSNYPSPYDIQEVINNFLKRNFVDNFIHEMGIFYMNARQEDIAKELSHIMFDISDIDKLRQNAYQASSKHTLSGFTLHSSNQNFSLQELYERVRDNDKVLASKGYRLDTLIKISKGTDAPIYKGSIEYHKKKPGRIELLDEEKGYSEFYLVDKGDGEWQVEVDGNKSSDGKEVQKLISGLVDKHTTSVLDINMDALKQKTTIEFFDELAKIGLGGNWRFTDVKHLAFKRGRDEENDDDEENGESIEKEQLTGISQAILEGRNLRDDPFVLQYEREGCIFTAMTYEFENSKSPETIQLRAEFKGSPKIFEVSIPPLSYKVTKDLNLKKESETLAPEKHRELRSLFWNNAKTVYIQLIDKKISKD